MALIQTVNANELQTIAEGYGREDQFTYEAWTAIGEYLESSSDGDVQIDIVSICCEYSEYASAQEVYDNYSTDIDADEWQEMDDEEKLEAIESFLQENTSVVLCDEDCIVFASF